MSKIDVTEDAKIRVQWSVLPVDYSKEKETDIVKKISQKYKIPRENISVEPNFISLNDDGDEVPLNNDIIENIQDPKFQQHLFKKYLDEYKVDNYNFEEIISIDNEVNAFINYEEFSKHKKYKIKWINWSNFLSYGDNNYFDFETLNGLVLLNGEPANQSGKSTFAFDLLHFLLFGETSKTSLNEQIFNTYRPEQTEVVIEGCLEIDGENFIIKRTLSRPGLAKRTDKSKTTQKIEYFKLMGDGNRESLEDEKENCEDSTSTKTNKVIKDAIGSKSDFDLIICANMKTLNDLISLKNTERGRLLNRWVGLLPLEEKDEIARERFNKIVKPTLITYKYDTDIIKSEVSELLATNVLLTEKISNTDITITKLSDELDKLNSDLESEIGKKTKIDENLTKIDYTTLIAQKNSILIDGKSVKEKKQKALSDLELVKDKNFSLDEYDKIIKDSIDSNVKLETLRGDINKLKTENKILESGEICPTCNRKLEGIDNSKKISENVLTIKAKIDEGIKVNEELTKINLQKTELEKLKKDVDEKHKLQVLIDKLSVDIENLVKSLNEKNELIASFENNKTVIENNSIIEAKINVIKENIKVTRGMNDNNLMTKRGFEKDIENNVIKIDEKNKILAKINDEKSKIRSWTIYLGLVGKNGISKFVLRTALPIINGELSRLLNGICDFSLSIEINNNNDVEFFITRGGFKSHLFCGSGFEQTAASLALRSVLAKISVFPKPQFIIFDEVLGGVAKYNYDNIKLLYDRILNDYSFIFQITHIDEIADWHNQTVTVSKKNNISNIIFKK